MPPTLVPVYPGLSDSLYLLRRAHIVAHSHGVVSSRREIFDDELEIHLKGSPFETYEFNLGSKFGSEFVDPDFRVVGKMKVPTHTRTHSDQYIVHIHPFPCSHAPTASLTYSQGLIRLMKDENEPSLLNLKEVLKPQSVKVRLYILRAIGLAAMDAGWP